jgi:hypothetical protein
MDISYLFGLAAAHNHLAESPSVGYFEVADMKPFSYKQQRGFHWSYKMRDYHESTKIVHPVSPRLLDGFQQHIFC